MKAATGELQLTVITLIAIAAVIGFFWLMWPNIQQTIQEHWTDATTNDRNTQNHGGTGMVINDYTIMFNK